MGYLRIKSDASIYVWADAESRVIVLVFVDDLTIASKSKQYILDFKSQLSKHFKLQDLGPTSFLLEVSITRDRSAHTLRLSQRQFILDLLERFNFADCSPILTAMEPGLRLPTSQAPSTPEDIEYMQTVPYINAVPAAVVNGDTWSKELAQVRHKGYYLQRLMLILYSRALLHINTV